MQDLNFDVHINIFFKKNIGRRLREILSIGFKKKKEAEQKIEQTKGKQKRAKPNGGVITL